MSSNEGQAEKHELEISRKDIRCGSLASESVKMDRAAQGDPGGTAMTAIQPAQPGEGQKGIVTRSMWMIRGGHNWIQTQGRKRQPTRGRKISSLTEIVSRIGSGSFANDFQTG